jgi:hypothetical protein
MFRSCFAFLGLLVALGLTATASLAADPDAAKAQTKALLEKAWTKSAAARTLADQCDLKSPPLQGHYQVAMAHWLVLMKQGSNDSYDKALESLESFFTSNPPAGSALLGLRAKAWIQVTKKTYGEALKTADRLAQAVTASSMESSANVPANHAEAIEFLGHVVGFLEGPAEKSIDDNALKKFEATVLARFDEPRKKLFHDAKTAVATEFAKYVDKVADAKDDSKAAAAAAKQDKQSGIAADGAKIKEDADKLAKEQQQLRDEFLKRMDSLNRQEVPLRQLYMGLQNQLTTANNTLSQNQTTVQNIRLQVNGEKDANRRQQLQNNLQQAQNNLDTAQRSADNISFQVKQAEANYNVIQQNKAVLVREAQAKGFQLENQMQAIGVDQQKNEAKAKRVAKSKAGPSPKAATLGIEASAFRTYDTFPLEESRDRLLTAVR